jgi:four helix bundle protein
LDLPVKSAVRPLSVAANIAEGCGRRSDGEMSRFLQIAYASASELEYHLLLARGLRLLEPKDFQVLAHKVDEVQRVLTSLIQRVRVVVMAKKVPIREAHGSTRARS